MAHPIIALSQNQICTSTCVPFYMNNTKLTCLLGQDYKLTQINDVQLSKNYTSINVTSYDRI